MSYRTYVNGHQLFGNNECYPEWLDFVKTQGAVIDESKSYQCRITDFDQAVLTCENIVMRLSREKTEQNAELLRHIEQVLREQPDNKAALTRKRRYSKHMFDFSDLEEQAASRETALFDGLYGAVFESFAFLPLALYLYCRDQLQPDTIQTCESGLYRIHRYKLKPGGTILVEAR